MALLPRSGEVRFREERKEKGRQISWELCAGRKWWKKALWTRERSRRRKAREAQGDWEEDLGKVTSLRSCNVVERKNKRFPEREREGLLGLFSFKGGVIFGETAFQNVRMMIIYKNNRCQSIAMSLARFVWVALCWTSSPRYVVTRVVPEQDFELYNLLCVFVLPGKACAKPPRLITVSCFWTLRGGEAGQHWGCNWRNVHKHSPVFS